jgi:lysozyme
MRVMQHGLLMLSGLAAGAGCLDREAADADQRPARASSISSAVTSGVCPTDSTVPGIDVSTYQGSVDWTKVAASGRKFAITRIGNGVNISDSTFAANWSGMAAAGMIRGAYQYFEPAQDAVDQANIVVAKLGLLGDGDLPAMLDMEVTGGQSAATITSEIHQWVDTVARGTGKTPMIYTGAYFWDGSVKSSDFADLPLVIAWYGTDCPGMPDAWSGCR